MCYELFRFNISIDLSISSIIYMIEEIDKSIYRTGFLCVTALIVLVELALVAKRCAYHCLLNTGIKRT